MDIVAFLEDVCATPGLPGMEGPVAERIAKEFKRFSHDVWIDALGNVYAQMGNPDGPTVLVCAHMDEIGLIVTGFDDRGGVQFAAMGGVDPRILPGCEVLIHGTEPVYGVIGVKPPHLTVGFQDAPKMKNLTVDTGYGIEKLKTMVKVGDPIAFKAPVTKLANGRLASKCMDDRACVTSMLVAMEQLQNTNLPCHVVFCATISEEVGCRGATIAGYAIDPDLAIAFDVTHGPCPGVDKSDILPLDCVAVTKGPLIHPAIHKRLMDTATTHNIKVEIEPIAGATHTDADALQVARNGIACGLLSIPLSYMHTTVETLSMHTIEEAGRLLARFLEQVDLGWEEWLCYKD